MAFSAEFDVKFGAEFALMSLVLHEPSLLNVDYLKVSTATFDAKADRLFDQNWRSEFKIGEPKPNKVKWSSKRAK